MKDKALGMALEFFETMKRYKRVRSNIFIRFEPTATGDYLDLREFDERAEPTITAIKQALAAPVQEPVAWVDVKDTHQGPYEFHGKELLPVGRHDLYTTPPQRTWVGLTDDEIDQGLLRSDYAFKTAEAWRAGVVFAMTKLKEKNT